MSTSNRRQSLAACALVVVLTACSSTDFRPTEVPPNGTPYEGLAINSYGPLSTAPLRYCDPVDDGRVFTNATPAHQAMAAETSSDIAKGIASVITAPVRGLTKVDATLVDLHLQDTITINADSSYPPVAVLSYSPRGILFWHSAKLVRPKEVLTAATAFCAKTNRKAVHVGSASRCPPIERGFGSQPIKQTFVLSAFQCAD